MDVEDQNKIIMIRNFKMPWDKFGITEDKSVDGEEKTMSSMMFFISNVLAAPPEVVNEAKKVPVKNIGKILRKHNCVPEELRNLPDAFFEGLQQCELDLDKTAITEMWESIGISFKFNMGHSTTSLSQVLNETLDVIIAPVIIPVNAENEIGCEGCRVRLFVISNSGINKDHPTTCAIGQSEALAWDRLYLNAIWTATRHDGENESFYMKHRLAKAELKPHMLAMTLALAESLAHNGFTVRCCERISPDILKDAELRSFRAKTRDTPRYEWFDFDPKNPRPIDPVEPEIVRDFIHNGDRSIRLERARRYASRETNWEKDSAHCIDPIP